MKANELMIGDWVIHPYYKRPSKIVYFNGSRVRVEYEEVEAESLRPIPLTPEILEKIGFIGEGYQILTLDDGHWLEYYNHEHRLTRFWEGIDEWQNHSKVRDIVFRCHCHYVHELQHALKLCCIEKEIEL